MKKKLVLIFVAGLLLMVLRPSLSALNTEDSFIAFEDEGNILISEYGDNQTTEYDSDGNIVWQKTGLSLPQDAERLSNGNTLIAEYATGRVFELDKNDIKVWQKGGLGLPVDAEELENGNILITEFSTQRVIEVDDEYNIVWEKTGLSSPFDAERLENGNTLIAESYPEGQVIEVDSSGNIVWQITDLEGPVDVERLANGNTLITEHVGRKVTEIDINKNIVWEKTGLLMPKDAERLANGNTLIVECAADRIIEVDSSGSNVWIKSGLHLPVDAERLPNLPPSVEIISPRQNYFNLRGMPLFPSIINTIVYGPINIKLNTTSSSGIDKVELYINNKLKETIEEEPYTFKWAPILCGLYKIKVNVYDNTGQNASDEINVLKWRIHPVLILVGSLAILKFSSDLFLPKLL
jgi:hypothetical protein